MATLKFSDTTPAAPGGQTNVAWQYDPTTGEVSANYTAGGGGGGISILGTAVFSATGGTISGLVMAGNVTAVTRTGAGQYAVVISGTPSNYIVQVTVGDTSSACIAQLDPVAAYTSAGFTIQALTAGGGGTFDPGLVFVTVIA